METESSMKDKLEALRAAFRDMKRASVFRKALAAEAALAAAFVPIEEIVAEIEKLKEAQGGGGS